MPTTKHPHRTSSTVLPAPEELWSDLPATAQHREFQARSRQVIADIVDGEDPRLLLVVGPCSIHDTTAALDYAIKLKQLADSVSDAFYIAMRTHFEKPRTTTGWKGLLYDPTLDGTHDIVKGLTASRQLLLELATLEMPAATEFLDPASPCYLADLISWGSVGARTAASQIHRQMASGLPMPVGFKNATDGDLSSAINGVVAALTPHTFLGINAHGRLAVIETRGNRHAHIVLRGGEDGPNYDRISVQEALQKLGRAGLPQRLMIDCSHDNCNKQHLQQVPVFQSIINQVCDGNTAIFGAVLESHLIAGSQLLPGDRSRVHGSQSVTDPCIDWETTENLVLAAYQRLKESSKLHCTVV